VILPIWHNVDKAAVCAFSPVLSDLLAITTIGGIEPVAESLLDVIFGESNDSPSALYPSLTRRFV
jgi:hypothetical protein